MDYSNKTVRRQDHLLDKSLADDILKTGKYGVLSMQSVEGGGYGVPMIFVWDGDSTLFLHGANEGRRLDCIRNNNKVTFCITGDHKVYPHHFTMGYQSVVLECEAFLDVDDTQKMKIFEMILDKYCVGYKSEGLEYAHKEFNNVTAIRLKIINATGKEEAVKDD